MDTPWRRRIFCNRTLNLRSIHAIGYDMDYTLIHYRTDDWEGHAYSHVLRLFKEQGWPVEDLSYDPKLMIRGVIVDTELGNVLKTNRFGFVKKAYHGTKAVPYERMRELYSRVFVDLAEPRFKFMNTLFSLSEACLFAQLVDVMDDGRLDKSMGYDALYRSVRRTVDYAHLEGRLKGEIIANPDRFVELDAETPLALLDQHHAGKKLVLITNSEWTYSSAMMSYAFDRFLPGSMTWRDLFDLVIVAARKPTFFTQNAPAFEVIDDEGRLLPVKERLELGKIYVGGNAGLVERCLSLDGDQVLYVGDHLFSDVHVSKDVQRWRTALVLREIEDEVTALEGFDEGRKEIERLMADKEKLEAESCSLRLRLQRHKHAYGPDGDDGTDHVRARLEAVRQRIIALDDRIKPLAVAADQMSNGNWGLLMRAGNDKSQLALQVEQYADIYMSRVSNFAHHTPFAYLRSARGSLPHDKNPVPDETITDPLDIDV
ncbi:MAG: HAD-IG family 5'-nucleotidase [Myxococcota bacterium]